MATFLEVFSLAVLLGVAATLTGRLLAAAFNIPLLRSRGLEGILASAFPGTGFLMLAFGWASYAGCRAPACLFVVGLLLSGLAAYLAIRGRLSEVLLLPRPGLCAGLVAGALAARVAAYLLPLALGSCLLQQCDALLYIGSAEWLQHHGFGTASLLNPTQSISDMLQAYRDHGFGTTPLACPDQPVELMMQTLQDMGHRMGPIFLLALVRAALPFRITAELYPVVMAWGTALNVASVFLLARWGLRVPRFHAAAGTCMIAVAFNSLIFSSVYGFLCQIYGTAMLAFGLALLSRLLARSNWRPGHAALLGLTLAAQLSMYSELSPILILATLSTGGLALWRARPGARGRFARFAALVVLALAVFGNIEYYRATRSLQFMTQVTSGWHLPWSSARFAKFVLGFYPAPMFTGDAPLSRWHLLVAALAGVIFLLGLVQALRLRRTVPLAIAVLVFAALAAYYRFGAHDPWTGAIGHTWNLLKLSKWAFPVVAALQVAGLSLVLRRLRWERASALVLGVAVAWYALPFQFQYARQIVAAVHATSGPNSRLADLRHLCQRIDKQAPRRLYLVSEPSGPWPRCQAAFLLCPRPFASNWKGSAWFEALREDLPEAFEPGTLYFQYGVPPFSKPVERLPFGYTRLDGTRPLLFQVQNPNGLEGQPGEGFTWVGTAPAAFLVFSPRTCHAVLSFTPTAGPCLPGTTRRSLRVTDGSGTSHEAKVDVVDGTRVELPVALTAGINRVEVTCVDEPTVIHPHDRRVMLVGVAGARVEVAEPTPDQARPTSPATE